jgi:hypothetical protein
VSSDPTTVYYIDTFAGYEYFEGAANMPEECASFKLRLRIEYSRLIDWADIAGLSDKNNHEKFDQKFAGDRHIILAVLSEMNALFEVLQKDYKELQWTEENGERSVVIPSGITTDGATAVRSHSGITFKVTGAEASFMPASKEVVEDIDLGAYSVFQSSKVPKKQQKRTRGLNHILSFSRKVSDVATQPRRLKWSALDRERYYQKLAKLTQLTDYLHQTMGDHQLNLLTQSTRETCLAMLQLTESVQEMKDLLAAARIVKIAEADQDLDSNSIFSQATTLVDPGDSQTLHPNTHSTLFERLVQFSIAYAETSAAKSSVGTNLDKVDSVQIVADNDKNFGNRTMAQFNGKTVWIEWKDFEPSPIVVSNDQPPTWGPPQHLVKRLDQLSALLERRDKPTEFSVPNCLGYFLDQGSADRFGFVFEMPRCLQQVEEPISLFELLSRSGSAFNITERVIVAQRIAASLFCLHAVSWLHKGLRSASILFFQTAKQARPENVFPIISGFDYSRPDTYGVTSTRPPNDPVWAIYCDPAYQGSDPGEYRKSFDIYSLGIILIEIALWRTADDILGISRSMDKIKAGMKEIGVSEDQVEDELNKLLGDTKHRILETEPQVLESVRSCMGERYCNAVRACITGGGVPEGVKNVGMTDAVEKAVVQQAYQREILDVLQGIMV